MIGAHSRNLRIAWLVDRHVAPRILLVEAPDPEPAVGVRARWWRFTQHHEALHAAVGVAAIAAFAVFCVAVITAVVPGTVGGILSIMSVPLTVPSGLALFLQLGVVPSRRTVTDLTAEGAQAFAAIMEAHSLAVHLADRQDADPEVLMAPHALQTLAWTAANLGAVRAPSPDGEPETSADAALLREITAGATRLHERLAAREPATPGVTRVTLDTPPHPVNARAQTRRARAREDAERAVELVRLAADDLPVHGSEE